jgi:H+/Cl- antiporter ClcA
MISWFRAILSCLIGLVIGVIFAALVNLIIPTTNLTGTLASVCLAAFFSAFAGYMVGAKQKK